MAIQLNHIATNYGITCPSAYVRIVGVSVQYVPGQPVKHVLSLNVDIYADAAAAANQGSRGIDSKHVSTTFADVEAMTGDDLLTKCYAWLATQEDFAGGIGV